MKRLLSITLAILLSSVCVNSQNKQEYKLRLIIEGIDSKTGTLLVGFCDSPKKFMKSYSYGVQYPVTSSTMEIDVNVLPLGEYAISVHHDENNNGKLDTGLFGIPKEKYGFSNNAKGFMGPPSFKECVINFTKDTTLTIVLQ